MVAADQVMVTILFGLSDFSLFDDTLPLDNLFEEEMGNPHDPIALFRFQRAEAPNLLAVRIFAASRKLLLDMSGSVGKINITESKPESFTAPHAEQQHQHNFQPDRGSGAPIDQNWQLVLCKDSRLESILGWERNAVARIVEK